MLNTGMVIVYDEDWAAFYHNGVKEVEGDTYIVEEHVFRLLGVTQRSSESLIDPETRNAWETLIDISSAEDRDRLAREELDKMRQEVERLEKKIRDRTSN